MRYDTADEFSMGIFFSQYEPKLYQAFTKISNPSEAIYLATAVPGVLEVADGSNYSAGSDGYMVMQLISELGDELVAISPRFVSASEFLTTYVTKHLVGDPPTIVGDENSDPLADGATTVQLSGMHSEETARIYVDDVLVATQVAEGGGFSGNLLIITLDDALVADQVVTATRLVRNVGASWSLPSDPVTVIA